MRSIPTPESSGEIVLDWLHDEGWSVAHAKRNGEWTVVATRGNQQIKTWGKSLEEAWYRATEQARLHEIGPMRLN